jgi:hypothetical protein
VEKVFNDFFYIDRRSLILFRITIGIVILYDMIMRMTDMAAHYTEQGVLPISSLLAHDWIIYYWSLCMLSTNPLFTYAVFGTVVIAAALMIAGIRPQWMALLCWIGLVSIQNRNPIIYQGGDDLLRQTMFFAMFLLLGTSARGHEGSYRIHSIASMAILCQILFSFFFSAFMKGRYEWFTEGSAVFYAFSLDQIARPLGLWLARHYSFTVIITRAVYILEASILIIFLIPFEREYVRYLVFLLIVFFALTLVATMLIGLFPVCFLGLAPLFLPTDFWDRWMRRGYGIPFKDTASTGIALSSSDIDITEWIRGTALGFLFTLIILWNVSTLPHAVIRFPSPLLPLMYTLRINQSWGMFAPTVLKADGWLVIKAELKDGSIIDLNNAGRALSFDKPAYVLDRYKNDRWRKYTEQIYMPDRRWLLPLYTDYLISSWDRDQKDHKKNIKEISLIYMLELSPPAGVKAVVDQVPLYNTAQGSGQVHAPVPAGGTRSL